MFWAWKKKQSNDTRLKMNGADLETRFPKFVFEFPAFPEPISIHSQLYYGQKREY